MIGKKILSENPITMAEAKHILLKGLDNVEEPNYEQGIAQDYLKKFTKLSMTKSMELVKELEKTNERVKKDVLVKLADLLPQDDEDIRAAFAKERYALTKDELIALLKVIQKYN